MESLKITIFGEVRKQNDELKLLSDDELNKYIFHNINGLRLSLTGFMVLKKIFTVYSFGIPVTIKSRHLKNLSTLTFPYFIAKSRLILFSEQDSLMIKLCGSIESFLENR